MSKVIYIFFFWVLLSSFSFGDEFLRGFDFQPTKCSRLAGFEIIDDTISVSERPPRVERKVKLENGVDVVELTIVVHQRAEDWERCLRVIKGRFTGGPVNFDYEELVGGSRFSLGSHPGVAFLSNRNVVIAVTAEKIPLTILVKGECKSVRRPADIDLQELGHEINHLLTEGGAVNEAEFEKVKPKLADPTLTQSTEEPHFTRLQLPSMDERELRLVPGAGISWHMKENKFYASRYESGIGKVWAVSDELLATLCEVSIKGVEPPRSELSDEEFSMVMFRAKLCRGNIGTFGRGIVILHRGDCQALSWDSLLGFLRHGQVLERKILML